MKNKALSVLFILCFYVAYSQTSNKSGIQTKTPTESLDVNGTTRLRTLPSSGDLNSINTKTNGSSSSSKDQTYNATKTVVVDPNGVVETIDGIAITVSPDIKTIQYIRNSTPINASTPTASITTIGNLSIRYNTPTTGSGNWIEFQTKVPNQVTAFGEVSGAGGNYFANWRTTSAAANTWYPATSQGVTDSNKDTYDLMITLHNSQEIYRVSLICNASIPANTSLNIPIVPAQVIIFIEKLQ